MENILNIYFIINLQVEINFKHFNYQAVIV